MDVRTRPARPGPAHRAGPAPGGPLPFPAQRSAAARAARPSPAHRVRRRVDPLLAAGIGLLLLVGGLATGVLNRAPTAPVAAPAPPARPVDVEPTTGRPALRAAALRIPALDVRSDLVALDVDAAGALQPPARADVAGWFVHSAVPGETGPSVIAGHVDSPSGPGVFARLGDLVPGDSVEVTRSDGRVLAYRVVSVERYPKNAFPTARVYGPTPAPELRLITCGGTFDHVRRRYRENVVVAAVPAGLG